MFEGINEVAVLVSAILAIAVGSVWYSPAVFGNVWMRAAGLTREDMELTKRNMAKLFLYAGVSNLLLQFVLALFVSTVDATRFSLYEMAAILTAFVGLAMVSGVIWEQKSWTYFTVNVGYLALIIFGGMSIIAFWPW